MEFLFPFPEDFHPPLSDPTPGKLVIERGFIKGFVDLVVEHDSRVYFADWKSDVLPSYSPETLRKHVADHYELQAKLYSLALVKALAIRSEADYERSFGGLFYIFLRSLRPQETHARAGCLFRSAELGRDPVLRRRAQAIRHCTRVEDTHEKLDRVVAVRDRADGDRGAIRRASRPAMHRPGRRSPCSTGWDNCVSRSRRCTTWKMKSSTSRGSSPAGRRGWPCTSGKP